jgi:methyl coenzyme M reductase subunit D
MFLPWLVLIANGVPRTLLPRMRKIMTVAGIWNLAIATPLGTIAVVLELTEHDEIIEGVAKSSAETVPLEHLVLHGNRLTWTQTVTRPMRLNLKFDVLIQGDALSGTSKAGMLPASKVTGTRVE